jgi:hypothetical protein
VVELPWAADSGPCVREAANRVTINCWYPWRAGCRQPGNRGERRGVRGGGTGGGEECARVGESAPDFSSGSFARFRLRVVLTREIETLRLRGPHGSIEVAKQSTCRALAPVQKLREAVAFDPYALALYMLPRPELHTSGGQVHGSGWGGRGEHLGRRVEGERGAEVVRRRREPAREED